MPTDITLALAGNPNTGKTSLFNALTGSHQHVGNWPGKTIEKKAGLVQVGGSTCHLIDLPGTYSLSAYSPEEVVARDFLLHERPDVIINVVDASNLERNLYLTVQLLELGLPLVIALNVIDIARRHGIRIDHAGLSTRLGGIPIVETVANKGTGLSDLIETSLALVQPQRSLLKLVARREAA